jgi:putative transposase
MKMELSRQAHSVFYLRYHLVISTKYRKRILQHGMQEFLKRIIRDISKHHPDIVILEVNTDKDHMHLLISIPPRYSISSVVNLIKSNSGTAMRKEFPWLDNVYWHKGGIWSIGYFVSTVGLDEAMIRKYIMLQDSEDRGLAKLALQ